MHKRKVGENAAEKLHRLVDQVNAELIPPGDSGEIQLKLYGGGKGDITLSQALGPVDGTATLYSFNSLEDAVRWLEGGSLCRLVMSLASQLN